MKACNGASFHEPSERFPPAWLAAVLWGLLTTASPAVADSPPFPPNPDQRPNIVLIIADD
jgi:hypothetical protein